MSYLYAGTIRNILGQSVCNTVVTVYTDAGGTVPAALEDVNGAPVANPTTTSDRGRVEIYSDSPTLWYKVAGDTLVMRLVRFCDLVQATVTGLPFLNVMDFGATGDGSTDDSAAINAAVSAAGTAGGTIEFPAGVYFLETTGILMPHSNAATLRFSGYGATIKLGPSVAADGISTDGHVFCGAARTAEDVWYQHLAIEGFVIDCDGNWSNAVICPGPSHISGNSIRCNYDDIVLRDINILNLGRSGNYGQGVNIRCYQDHEDRSDPSYIQHIRIENVHIEGGVTGVFVGGGLVGAADNVTNIITDDVILRDCFHDTVDLRTDNTITSQSDSFQLGQSSHGGSLFMERCIGMNNGEYGIEVNGWDNAIIRDCVVRNAASVAFGVGNFNHPVYTDGHVLFEGCRAEYYGTTAERDGCIAKAFQIAGLVTTAGDPHGSVTLRDCSYMLDAATIDYPDTTLASGNAIFVDSDAQLAKLVVDGFKCDMNIASMEADWQFVEPFRFTPRGPANVVLRDIDIKYVTDHNSVTSCYDSLFVLNGTGGVTYNIDGVTLDYTVTDPGLAIGFRLFVVGLWVTDDDLDNISIKNVNVRQYTGPANGSVVAVYKTFGTLKNGFTIEDSDFSNMPSTTDVWGYYNSMGQAFAPRIRTRNVHLPVEPTVGAITVPAAKTIDEITLANPTIVRTTGAHGLESGDLVDISGSNSTPSINGTGRVVTKIDATHFSIAVNVTLAGSAGSAIAWYHNRDHYDEELVVLGGTVSGLVLSPNDGTSQIDLTQTAGSVFLRGGDHLRIANSSAPTVTKVPRS
jgi:hypothetical protein